MSQVSSSRFFRFLYDFMKSLTLSISGQKIVRLLAWKRSATSQISAFWRSLSSSPWMLAGWFPSSVFRAQKCSDRWISVKKSRVASRFTKKLVEGVFWNSFTVALGLARIRGRYSWSTLCCRCWKVTCWI